MLRVAEQSFRSDTGRQRTANEDSFFVRAPVFAVADGMGGAQAGEVASRIAAEAFEPAAGQGEAPEAFLREIVEDANRRIHELSRRDRERSGMGTTLTAALVSGDEVSLAHVGDSRAYLFRDGELRLLTSDHSLVEELVRQGRLTEEEAEGHPQRSIITRALGPEPEVEVDTMTFQARGTDVFLLCSDGLTTMVDEERIAQVLRESGDLDEATSRLVREANEAGGRDNITIVAFRVVAADAQSPGESATLIGPTAQEAGLSTPAVRDAVAKRAGARGGAAAPVARTRRRLRRALIGGGAALIVAALALAAVWGARQVYFLGVDEGGRMALYRGLPYELPFELDLYSEVISSPLRASSVPPARRDSLTDHELRGRDDAISLLRDLEATAQPPPPPPRGDRERARNGSGARERDGGRAEGPGSTGAERAGSER